MKYSIQLLKEQILEGIQPEYYFFGGHTPNKDGVVDKSCLSQWFPSPFMVDEMNYATAEHWMMAQKALLFDDEDACYKILVTEKPAIAKTIGKTVKNFDEAKWKELSYGIAVEGNRHKFRNIRV